MTHGLTDHPLYKVWHAMNQRCYNENNKAYPRYGGRGIRMCESWVQSFMAFFRWSISNGYSFGLTIDRIDNDGNYEPGNCRWTTMDEQVQNQSKTKMNPSKIRDIRKDTRAHSVIARDYGVDESTISRIQLGRTWKNIL